MRCGQSRMSLKTLSFCRATVTCSAPIDSIASPRAVASEVAPLRILSGSVKKSTRRSCQGVHGVRLGLACHSIEPKKEGSIIHEIHLKPEDSNCSISNVCDTTLKSE